MLGKGLPSVLLGRYLRCWFKQRETAEGQADSRECKGHRKMGAEGFIRKHPPSLTLCAQCCAQKYPLPCVSRTKKVSPPNSFLWTVLYALWLHNTNLAFWTWRQSLTYSLGGLHDVPIMAAIDFYRFLYVYHPCFRIKVETLSSCCT